jgi:tetratricopeptide (TPR) repeat protein
LASLNDYLQPETSITEKDRALGLFTDRIRERRLFASYINDDPPRSAILFFHGDGGNGKSWLLHILKERYCRRLAPDVWAKVRDSEDDSAFTATYEANNSWFDAPQPLPCAFLDFEVNQSGFNPRIDLDGLISIRKELGRQGLRFPLFDWAILKYQIKGRGIAPENLKKPFPTDEMNFGDSLVELLYENKYTGKVTSLLTLFNKRFNADWALYCKKRKLDESLWEKLERLNPETELYDRLPELLAQDINAARLMDNAPKRIVLLFDTHEAFWHKDRDRESVDTYFQKDEWLRKLLRELDRENGIVTVLAGREPPRWADAPRFPVPLEFKAKDRNTGLPVTKQCLEILEVGTLTREDAEEYLIKAKVGEHDPVLRQALIDFAEIGKDYRDQVHPLYLGLCGEIVLAAERNGEALSADNFAVSSDHQNKIRLLVTRLLKYCIDAVQNAVINMAAARFFDDDLFCALGSRLKSSHDNVDACDELKRFSFVKKTKINNKDRYGIHALLRRTLRELEPEKTAKADSALEALYRERLDAGDSNAIVEAIYHANCRDWERGYEEWLAVFDAAKQRSQYALCDELLALVPELSLETDFSRGMVATSQADVYRLLSRYDRAHTNYAQAVDAYDRALALAPDDIAALNNRGNALQGLADLQAGLSQTDAAQQSYAQAVDAYDRALKLAPGYLAIQNNRGNALAGLKKLLGN